MRILDIVDSVHWSPKYSPTCPMWYSGIGRTVRIVGIVDSVHWNPTKGARSIYETQDGLLVPMAAVEP